MTTQRTMHYDPDEEGPVHVANPRQAKYLRRCDLVQSLTLIHQNAIAYAEIQEVWVKTQLSNVSYYNKIVHQVQDVRIKDDLIYEPKACEQCGVKPNSDDSADLKGWTFWRYKGDHAFCPEHNRKTYNAFYQQRWRELHKDED